MARSHRQGQFASTRAGRRAKLALPVQRPPPILPRLKCADRKSLLLGTALGSTLLIGALLTPTPAAAQVTCVGDIGSGSPISHLGETDPILCINTEPRTNPAGNAISLSTIGNNYYIDLYSSGALTARTAGIATLTDGDNSPTAIRNLANITTTSVVAALGIFAYTAGDDSLIDVVNSGDVTAYSGTIAFGIRARSVGANSPIDIVNSGDVTVTGNTFNAFGIHAYTYNADSPISIWNSGEIFVISNGMNSVATGIYARTGYLNSDYDNGSISILNSGDVTVTTTGVGTKAYGIYARTDNDDSAISIVNSGDLTVTDPGGNAYGIRARAVFGGNIPVSIVNSGDIVLPGGGFGIRASTGVADPNNPLEIVNSGEITITGGGGTGIAATTFVDNSPLSIQNSGDIAVTNATGFATGISANTFDPNSPLSIVNSGDITAITTALSASGINAYSRNSSIDIVNSGKITASGNINPFGDFSSYGIDAHTEGADSSISIINSGTIDAAIGINAETFGLGSSITIDSSGSVYGDLAAILALSTYGTTTIVNSGDISAGSHLAIDVDGGAATIFNRGLITGFVDVTDNADTFINQQGGVFEARLTSYFGLSDDRFRNEQGGLVHTAADSTAAEFTSFVALERFENKGLISLADGKEDDVFQISNTVGGTDLDFVASGGSTLLVDAFLGPPGSTADNFIIDGDVTGKTALAVNNTNHGLGVFNPQGIPVVLVPNGEVQSDAFFLPHPINTGLFDWDLYFVKTGSGFFELRSFPGGGAQVLPQLLTATQDIFHTTNETWFDRTADLRVLLNGGVPYGTSGGKLGEGAPQVSTSFTPAVWMKGSGTWLEQEDTATSSAYGRTYRYNLNRDLDVWNLQGGIDFGKKGVLAEGDALVFGVLAGAVLGNLDYDQLVRQFDVEGGEAGLYATYLKGGLFVDTLFKVDFLEFDTNDAPGLPGSLDATAWGFRTDTGYRFGGFRGGLFIEPLATIAVVWSEIDDFALGGNKVTFNDDANVRGRLGLRVGTSREVWSGIVMEPFVIGSVWGTLSGENRATLNSLGNNFTFTDEPQDVWGVVSTGVNFFSPSASTSVFAKLDVTFGDDLEGVAGKAGMRVSW